LGQGPTGQDRQAPQAALAACPALTVAHRDSVVPGTGVAVSADGRWLAQFVHTNRGAELTLLDRDARKAQRVELDRPQLPPGVTWRVAELAFSPGGDLLAVRSTGAIWVLASASARLLYQIGLDAEKQIYPGQLSLARGQLAVIFWPPESYLAYARPKQPVEARIYDALSGKLLRRIMLALETPEEWSELMLSPGGERLAVLMRATRWPGKARLAVFAADTGKLLWQKKLSAEDVAWSGDGQRILALGGELVWLDAHTGKKVQEANTHVRFTEYQKLRLSEPTNTAAGHFVGYSPLRRALDMADRRDRRVLLWRLDTGKSLCDVRLDPGRRVDAWLTARGELIALEESYEVRPALELLRAAEIVTYRLPQ